MAMDKTSKVWGTLALAAVMIAPVTTFAQGSPQVKTSDAQVEANVLKAFAGDARLANQPINTSTVFGTVTLTGSVNNDGARDAAEQIASRTEGVKKVVDQLSVGAPTQVSAANGMNVDPAAANSLPADGYAMPASSGAAAAAANPQANGSGNSNTSQQAYGAPSQQYPQGQYPQQQGAYPQGQYPPQDGGYAQGQYPQQQGGYPQGQYPPPQGGDPQAQGQYPPPQGDGSQYPPRRLYRRDYERQMAAGQNGQPQGQRGGQPVTLPPNTELAVSINHWMSSGDAAPGSAFQAIVAQDVVANGVIAVPRGATVDGTVIDAKGAGALKGRGTLTLQLNTLELGGQRIALQSDPFTVNGRDKTARSINSTIVGAGLGALLGAAIGRGEGAAIGAGVGGAAGLGSAAASNGGQANIPPESLLRFRLTAPTQMLTVSEMEMQRLGGFAGPAAGANGQPYPPNYYRRGYGY